jgi:hypothetical protein
MDYWYLKNKTLFKLFKENIDANYPTLNILIQDELVHLMGTLRIKDDKNIILGSFLIDVNIPNNFPREIPEVREIGNKIPHIRDRHFDEISGIACLCFRDAVFLYWDENSTIVDFIKNLIEPFFLWQIEYEATGGKNIDKALPHGIEGSLQFYKEILGTDDRTVIYKFVEYLAKDKVKGHWACYCSSGKKMRDCHIDTIKKYKLKIRACDARKTFDELYKCIFSKLI